jgi:type IV pilus assembly protein PilB
MSSFAYVVRDATGTNHKGVSEAENEETLAGRLRVQGLEVQSIQRTDAVAGEVISPIVLIANTIIEQALTDGASEIEVEPCAEDVTISYRIGGELREARKLPKHVQRELIARYKVLASMNVTEESAPQTGHIGISNRGKDYDLEVSAHPALNGEKIVIRIAAKE